MVVKGVFLIIHCRRKLIFSSVYASKIAFILRIFFFSTLTFAHQLCLLDVNLRCWFLSVRHYLSLWFSLQVVLEFGG